MIKRYSGVFKVLKKGLTDLTKGLRDPKKLKGQKEEIFIALARNYVDSSHCKRFEKEIVFSPRKGGKKDLRP